jgi:hypothetical protein
MFLNGISEFESKFKLFDRLNSVVFNVWRDKKALAYRDSDIARITNEYRNYISCVRTLAEQANQLERNLEQKRTEIDRLRSDVANLALNSQIRDCCIFSAYGETQQYREDGSPGRTQKSDKVRFVAKRGTERGIAESMVGGYDKVYVNQERSL